MNPKKMLRLLSLVIFAILYQSVAAATISTSSPKILSEYEMSRVKGQGSVYVFVWQPPTNIVVGSWQQISSSEGYYDWNSGYWYYYLNSYWVFTLGSVPLNTSGYYVKTNYYPGATGPELQDFTYFVGGGPVDGQGYNYKPSPFFVP